MLTDDDMIDLAVAGAVRLAGICAVADFGEARDRDDAFASVERLSAAALDAVADPGGYALAYAAVLRAMLKSADVAALIEAIAREIGGFDPADGAVPAGVCAVLAGALGAAMVMNTYSSRPDATRARESLAAITGPIFEGIGDALGADALDAVLALTGAAAVELSRIAASSVPLVRVETGVSLPSTALAWRLYADASRAQEIVGRNGTATPIFLPTALDALSS